MTGQTWEMAVCHETTGKILDSDKLDELLADGWEPFAVTVRGVGGFVYHFRRPKDDK